MNHGGTEDTERAQRRDEGTGRRREGDPLTGETIAAAIEVHRCFGPGLLESIYAVPS
jgi:hypothetical protein